MKSEVKKLIVGLALLFAGCALFEPSKGLHDDVALAVAQWRSLNLTLIDVCGRRVLTQTQCDDGENMSAQVGAALSTAQFALVGNDATTAGSQLQIAQGVLAYLHKLVATRDVQP